MDERKSEREPASRATEEDVAGPRLTPQGRSGDEAEGEDATDPSGEGAARGQTDQAEGGR